MKRLVFVALAAMVLSGCQDSSQPLSLHGPPANPGQPGDPGPPSQPGTPGDTGPPDDPGQPSLFCIAPPSGLVNWWPGDGDATDIVGGINGMLQNGATFAAGKVDQAFSLDGVDDYVGAGTFASFSFIENTGQFTIDAWIRLNDPNVVGLQTITENSNTGLHKGHFFLFDNRPSTGRVRQLRLGLTYGPDGGVFDSKSPNEVINDTDWHHVAVTSGGSSVVFYIDGIAYPFTGAIPGTSSGNSTNLLRIGDDTAPNPAIVEPFGGLIDEVEFFNRALSATEIQALFDVGMAGKCKP